MSSLRVARVSVHRTRIHRDCIAPLRRWRSAARWAWRQLNAAPSAARVVLIAAAFLAVFSTMDLVYQVARKPTELFPPVESALNKTPAETWQRYAPLFREYSTATITPELLAAVERRSG
jgi:hypothetical protein